MGTVYLTRLAELASVATARYLPPALTPDAARMSARAVAARRATTSARRGRRAATLRADARAANAAWLERFAAHLAARPAHTREAYLRDVARARARSPATPTWSRSPRRSCAASSPRCTAAACPAAASRGCCRRGARSIASRMERDPRLVGEPVRRAAAAAGRRRKLPSALSPDEAVRLVAIDGRTIRWRCAIARCSSSPTRRGCGCPSSPGVDVDRVDLATGEVRVWGKGAKERIVPVGAAALDGDPRVARGPRDVAAASMPRRCSSARGGRRIAPRTIQRRLAAWAVEAGAARHVHPHMLRHSFASHVLQSSGDLRAVQEMLGHASIASTQVYTHLDFQALAKVYDAAHPRARKK